MTFFYPHVICLEDRITLSHTDPKLTSVVRKTETALGSSNRGDFIQGIGFNGIGKPDGAKGKRWGYKELVIIRRPTTPGWMNTWKDVMLPDPGWCSQWTLLEVRSHTTDKSTVVAAQLLKAMEGTASWLHGCFFAALTVTSAISPSPQGQKATEAWDHPLLSKTAFV